MAIARKDGRLKTYAAEEELSDANTKLVELQSKFQKSKHQQRLSQFQVRQTSEKQWLIKFSYCCFSWTSLTFPISYPSAFVMNF